LAALLLAGCSTSDATPGQATGTPLADQPVTGQPMPWPDGGAMLWPLEQTAADDSAADKFGFIDQSAKIVVEPKYSDYAICFSDGAPVKALGRLSGKVDVLDIATGRVERSIKAADRSYLACHEGKYLLNEEGDEDGHVAYREIYNIDTGKLVSQDSDFYYGEEGHPVPWKEDDGGAVWEPPDEPALPDGYPVYIGGDFASNDAGDRVKNVSTGAEFAVPDGYTADSAVGDLLLCSGEDSGSIILDAAGRNTGFLTMDQLWIADADQSDPLEMPYYWATSATRQGYVDAAGHWYFQQAA
jgi:hypothetical protein